MCVAGVKRCPREDVNLINQPSSVPQPPTPAPSIKRLRGLRREHHQTRAPDQDKLHNSTPSQRSAIMAPKRNVRDATPSSTATAQSSGTSTPVPPIPTKAKQSSNLAPQDIVFGVWEDYLETTPQRTKLIDVFMLFLVVVGGLQFAYCLISGNYVCAPMNAPWEGQKD